MLVKDRPLVSIISVNYNQLTLTCEMLASLRKQDYPNYEIILVDNASSEDPSPRIKSEFPEVRLICSDQNLGFAGGNNLGIQASKGDYLFFVNNDTELTSGLIEGLVACFQELPELGCVSPLICYFPGADGREIIQYAGSSPLSLYTARNTTLGNGELNTGQFSSRNPTPYAHGAAMMVSRKVIKEVGGLPEAFFLYYEELDWCEQIRKAGFTVYVEPNVKIYHKESAAVGADSPLKTYYINRSRILFVRRNRNKGQLIIFAVFFFFITLFLKIPGFVYKRQWQHLREFYKAINWNLHNSSTSSGTPEKTLLTAEF